MQILALLLFLFQAPSDETFQKANDAYAGGRYEEARGLYESLLTDGSESAELRYNLGNTYFKLKRIGLAILHYEKSLRLSPLDEDVLANLEIAELRKKDRMVVPPDFFLFVFVKGIRDSFSVDSWTRIVLILWWAFASVVILGMIGKLTSPGWLRIVLFFSLLIALTGLTTRWYYDHGRQEAIVLSPMVDARNEPSVESSVLFVLHEGSKVRIRTEHDGWIEIVLPDGKNGWIRSKDAGRI